jgi:hypothetical protein
LIACSLAVLGHEPDDDAPIGAVPVLPSDGAPPAEAADAQPDAATPTTPDPAPAPPEPESQAPTPT